MEVISLRTAGAQTKQATLELLTQLERWNAGTGQQGFKLYHNADVETDPMKTLSLSEAKMKLSIIDRTLRFPRFSPSPAVQVPVEEATLCRRDDRVFPQVVHPPDCLLWAQ